MTQPLSMRFLKTASIYTLALSLSAAGLTACSEAPTEKTHSVTQKTLKHTAAGQTDADHLYLEEVLGESALAEVEGWNARTLDRLSLIHISEPTRPY